VQITTQTSPDDAAAELTGALQQAGFTVQSSPGQGGTTLLGEGNDLSLLVLVTAADGATSVLYTVGRQAAE
jgi:DNA-binding IscR family transcriptional regulator